VKLNINLNNKIVKHNIKKHLEQYHTHKLITGRALAIGLFLFAHFSNLFLALKKPTCFKIRSKILVLMAGKLFKQQNITSIKILQDRT
jgi:hypothetical protein